MTKKKYNIVISIQISNNFTNTAPELEKNVNFSET